MKSIDEMSIPDLLYRVRYSISDCYGEEILSRFAELEKQIESLKCCGNCKSFHHCQFLISDTDVIVKSSGNPFTVYTRLKKPENFDCDKWEGRK